MYASVGKCKLKLINKTLVAVYDFPFKVTHNNEENQTYLLKYNEGMILDTLVKLYRLCDAEIPLYPVNDITDKESTGTVIREALLVTLKVLINLTHHFNKQCKKKTLVFCSCVKNFFAFQQWEAIL